MMPPVTVAVPWVAGKLEPETRAVVVKQWPDALFPMIRADSELSFAAVLLDLWSRAGSLIICNMDIVPPPRSISALARCYWPWCSHPVNIGSQITLGTLGLMHFSARLKAKHPDLFQAALCRPGTMHPRVSWQSVDVALILELQRRGFKIHPHAPEARHLHRYSEQLTMVDP